MTRLAMAAEVEAMMTIPTVTALLTMKTRTTITMVLLMSMTLTQKTLMFQMTRRTTVLAERAAVVNALTTIGRRLFVRVLAGIFVTPMPPEVTGHYCECHHQDAGGDDGEDEPCCEHHAAIQAAAAERTATASESIVDDKMDGIENQLSGINDKLSYSTLGDISVSVHSLDASGVNVPLPSVPNVSVSSLSLQEVGEVRKEDRAFAVLRIHPVTKT